MAAGTASALHPRITPASADCRRPGRPPLMEIRAMRMDKLTSRFQQALADAQSLAVGRDNNLIEPAPLLLALLDQSGRSSGERRVGKEGASTCRSRWSPYH